MVLGSPSISLVPLDGEEDIGEVADGFWWQLSRLEDCTHQRFRGRPGAGQI